jgi:hypothetical protein
VDSNHRSRPVIATELRYLRVRLRDPVRHHSPEPSCSSVGRTDLLATTRAPRSPAVARTPPSSGRLRNAPGGFRVFEIPGDEGAARVVRHRFQPPGHVADRQGAQIHPQETHRDKQQTQRLRVCRRTDGGAGRRGADVADGCIAAERFRTIPARRTGPDIDSSQRIARRDPGPDALARYNSVHR